MEYRIVPSVMLGFTYVIAFLWHIHSLTSDTSLPYVQRIASVTFHDFAGRVAFTFEHNGEPFPKFAVKQIHSGLLICRVMCCGCARETGDKLCVFGREGGRGEQCDAKNAWEELHASIHSTLPCTTLIDVPHTPIKNWIVEANRTCNSLRQTMSVSWKWCKWPQSGPRDGKKWPIIAKTASNDWTLLHSREWLNGGNWY